jgi:hypothetical protein
MKILNELKIKSGKLMKNEELLNLKGGVYPTYSCNVTYSGGSLGNIEFSDICTNATCAQYHCENYYQQYFGSAQCTCTGQE